MEKNFKIIFDERKKLNETLDETYFNMIENINNNIKNLENMEKVLQDSFLEACALDFAGEIVKNYFDASDYNITIDQLCSRILNFRYDNEIDPLNDVMNTNRKNLYNLENSKESLERLKNELGEPEKLFIKQKVYSKKGKPRNEYKDKSIIEEGKKEYRSKLEKEGNLKDETGSARERLEVDHILPLATAGYYKKYLDDEGIQKIKKFYNSEDNFGMLGKSANGSKGDISLNPNSKEKKINIKDIKSIYHGTPEEITKKIVNRFEGKNLKNKRAEKTIQNLKNDGILDENGKVKPNVKRKIEDDIRYSQNQESKVILKNTNYKKVSMNAGKETGKQLVKIVGGQLIYYLVPPLIYEIKINLKNENDSDNILENLKSSFDRIVEYISSKKSDIFKNILGGGLKKFFKNFFDIIIQIVKATVKKILKMIRQLVLTVVDAVKILLDSSKTFVEKMDAISQLIAGLVVNIALEVLFEYIEKQFMIPEMFLMPLQMIVTIMATNFIMLSLKRLDLFGTNKQFKIEKIKAIFEEEREKADLELQEKLENVNYNNQQIFEELKIELKELQKNIQENNIFTISIKDDIKRMFQIFGKELKMDSDLLAFLNN